MNPYIVHHRMSGGMYNFGWFDIIAGFFWIVSVVFLCIVLFRIAKRGHEVVEVEDTRISPIEIAKERYAKGEITKEQYLDMKKTLAD